ncbi:MAG: beta-galactosidase [Sphingobacteriia bacterium]|nr:beta-galactosidase [Sphingobacteriia bacterium]
MSQQNNIQPMLTPWTEKVNPDLPHQEYPRPQMVRDHWKNLNGKWNCAIVAKGNPQPAVFDQTIVVPFPVESYLSGVMKTVGAEQELWYHRNFSVNKQERKGRIFLHFGAVDWKAEVFVNGKQAGQHQGGFDPFSLDITSCLVKDKNQELVVRVWDPCDQGPQPRGKQVSKPRGIWYTSVTGIWQTVWLEFVPEEYIKAIKISSDWDNQKFKVLTEVAFKEEMPDCEVKVFENGQLIARNMEASGQEIEIYIPNARSWTPDNPFLYDLEISLYRGKQLLDKVSSYGALRKISTGYDANGMLMLELNGKQLFQYGPLDQGWWPDGLYTAPTDEALAFDISKTKELGFNMIRKHVKVEPARWYYHCDRLGMLVWQDMPSGDLGNVWEQRPGIYRKGTDRERSAESEHYYKSEWKSIIDALSHFQSIVVWVPFNEGWGQFRTEEITEWTKQYDPSRLVNSASGGNFELQGNTIVGDIFDVHNYPDPVMPDAELFGKVNVLVLGEFGGLGLPIEGHTWQEKDNWGYQRFKNQYELWDRYQTLIEDLKILLPEGLAAAVYTQTTDVEIEVNGLMTYDRKVTKFPVDLMKKLHEQLYKEN